MRRVARAIVLDSWITGESQHNAPSAVRLCVWHVASCYVGCDFFVQNDTWVEPQELIGKGQSEDTSRGTRGQSASYLSPVYLLAMGHFWTMCLKQPSLNAPSETETIEQDTVNQAKFCLVSPTHLNSGPRREESSCREMIGFVPKATT